ncbi:MAG: phage tail tape measure protein [Deltaproteobacteria bacterium]|nr:phage tail tape measure protein [Deltaproteobacteria bacterium]
MSKIEVGIILSGDSRGLERTLNRSSRSIQTYGRRAIGTFTKIGKTIETVSNRYMTGINTLVSGAALMMAGRSVIDIDSRLARLAIQAGLSRKEMFSLKKELFDIASTPGMPAPTELLAGIDAIVERTGNFKFAIRSVKQMGMISSATGASMADVGATVSNLQEKMGVTEDQVLKVFDILAAQGKKGSFTLQNMSRHFERLLSSAASFGVQGEAGIREFGAFLQIARRGAGNAEQATTAVERTIADLLSNWKKVRTETGGFIIFDVEKSNKEGRAVLKNFDVVLQEVIRRTNGDTTKLRKIFGEESIKAIEPLANSFRKFGDFREWKELAGVGGSGAMIMKDFAFWSEQTASRIQDMRNQLSDFANENLAGPIDLFTKALTTLNNHPVITKGGLWALLGLGGVMAGSKFVGGIKDLIGIFRGKGGKGGGLGGPLGAGGGPVPVYVVNSRMSLLDMGMGKPGTYSTPGTVRGGAGTAGSLSGISRIGSLLLSLAGPLGVLAAALGAASLAHKALGNESDEHLMDRLFPDETGPAVTDRAPIEINMRIDKENKVVVETNDMNTRVNGGQRGEF